MDEEVDGPESDGPSRGSWGDEEPAQPEGGKSGLFGSVDDAIAWAERLSKEELLVELEFLGLRPRQGRAVPKAELARRLAESIIREERGRGKEAGSRKGEGGRRVGKSRGGDTYKGEERVMNVKGAREELKAIWEKSLAQTKGADSRRRVRDRDDDDEDVSTPYPDSVRSESMRLGSHSRSALSPPGSQPS